ncbi:MAG: MmcQ/YjbR family DNA-binding protein [Planctomycetes bacterium]|nr:MmcQ/YjbR family DNA-binding protein [Planctomycetota bacterium]
MKERPHGDGAPIETLRAAALRLPGTAEGVACEGTALEKRTIKARGKAFLFLGPTSAMLKLGASVAEATALAAAEPDRYRVGAHSWVTVTFGAGASPPAGLMARWVEESYRLVAPKQLSALLPGGGAPTPAPAKPRKKAPRTNR